MLPLLRAISSAFLTKRFTSISLRASARNECSSCSCAASKHPLLRSIRFVRLLFISRAPTISSLPTSAAAVSAQFPSLLSKLSSASLAKRTRTTASCILEHALISAVSSLTLRKFTSALLFRSRLTISVIPDVAAACSAVQPCLSAWSIVALCLMSSLTASRWPDPAARCSEVQPRLSARFTSSPASSAFLSSVSIALSWPYRAATINGVASGSEGSGPFSSNSSTGT
mmetsp:Transcript_69406/g.184799  ORF Transcript_69406/g.184799 Transcript_69406/m.184799 type:complete len:228 (-) Transcript_69406:582-1265(-)